MTVLAPVAAMAVTLAACGPSTPKITEFTATKALIGSPRNGVSITAAYVTLVSPIDDSIVGVSSTEARVVEMHEMTTEGAMMRMRRIDHVDLSAGVPVEFKSDGLHLMVFDPKPMAPGATFPITFVLKSGISKTVEFAQAP
jgi:copper(I)-binding protein